jgi:hypothetical protein
MRSYDNVIKLLESDKALGKVAKLWEGDEAEVW